MQARCAAKQKKVPGWVVEIEVESHQVKILDRKKKGDRFLDKTWTEGETM